jgi:uncharacterized protein involved in outer membrane biogenesis
MMSGRSGKFARRALVALSAFLLLAWVVPYLLGAERFRRRLETRLETILHRPVMFGRISFHLLPDLGFTVENAVILEDRRFGFEPFMRADRIDCGLRWRSLWNSRLDISHLYLTSPNFNLVRNERGEWNAENLLLKSAILRPPGSEDSASPSSPAGDLDIDAADARINFKSGNDKKPFALTEVHGRLTLSPLRGTMSFGFAGNPLRTDLPLPTPGPLELEGFWRPGPDLLGPLDVRIQTRDALLYNWVPLLTGQNPEIYGVLDGAVHLTGSIRLVRVEGQSRLSQLHRWEQLPPSDAMPCSIHFRGQIDRDHGRITVESLETSFANSRAHLSGTVNDFGRAPMFDLVVAIERSRLEDLLAMGFRLSGIRGNARLSGRVDGLVSIGGGRRETRFGGFLTAKDVQLSTSSRTFPASEISLQIDRRGVRLTPFRLALAPGVELFAEGLLEAGSGQPRYSLTFSTKAVQLRDVVQFARALDPNTLKGLDAKGMTTLNLHIAGVAWPPSRPSVSGHAELRAARLLIPGLTAPLNIPKASVQVNGDQIVVDPIVAVMGTSVFSGRLEHRGERKQPWAFAIRANSLCLEQAALWFDALGHRQPLPLLERLPGIRSLTARRMAASNLFGALHATGYFSTPVLSYRTVVLKDFRTLVELSGRIVKLGQATFRSANAHGSGNMILDISEAPARIDGDISLSGLKLHALAPVLPPSLSGIRGTGSAIAHLKTRGLTRQEMMANLAGKVQVTLKEVSFADFDPIQSLAREASLGEVETSHGEVNVRAISAEVEVRDGRATFENVPVEISGARLILGGAYVFGSGLDLVVLADLHHVRRRFVRGDEVRMAAQKEVTLRLAGPLARLAVIRETEASRAER